MDACRCANAAALRSEPRRALMWPTSEETPQVGARCCQPAAVGHLCASLHVSSSYYQLFNVLCLSVVNHNSRVFDSPPSAPAGVCVCASNVLVCVRLEGSRRLPSCSLLFLGDGLGFVRDVAPQLFTNLASPTVCLSSRQIASSPGRPCPPFSSARRLQVSEIWMRLV